MNFESRTNDTDRTETETSRTTMMTIIVRSKDIFFFFPLLLCWLLDYVLAMIPSLSFSLLAYFSLSLWFL